MSGSKFGIFFKIFSVATYSPMSRLNIDFVGQVNTDDDSGYTLVIIDTVFFSTLVATEHRLRYCLKMAVTY